MDDATKKAIQDEVTTFFDTRFEWAADARAYLVGLIQEHYMFGYEDGWAGGRDSGFAVGYDQGYEDGCNSFPVAGPVYLDGN